MADDQNDTTPDDRVQVQIGGRTYTLRGNRNPDAVRELAAFVDEKMNDIAARTSTADTARLAILAALNIASDLFTQGGKPTARAKTAAPACRHEARDRDLCRILDAALSA